MAEKVKQSGGRRIISQAEADALVAKSGVDPTSRTRVGKTRERLPMNRREFLAYATAGSLAVLTALGLGTIVSPNSDDDLVAQLPDDGEWIPGGFAYPRIKVGEFGGKFILTRTPDSYTTEEAPELNAAGKFYVVKVQKDDLVSTNNGDVGADLGDTYLQAIYQVCTHLGCLIPFQSAENRFICPCHGSTFQRSSNYVLGPAPRNLDQFPVTIEDGVIVVDTGKKATGLSHA